MFMNRLRHDDSLEIFFECSQDVLSAEIEEDKNIDLILSDNDISLAKRFTGKEKKIICIKKIELMIADFLKILSYLECRNRKKKDKNTMLKIIGVRLNTFRE